MASTSSEGGKPDRLFVGNLSPTVDEYTLVQVFSKYGKITKLDLMVHNSGPQKGKPRGYAFVEYESKDDAVKALVKLHDRLLRGRKLVVTYANTAPADEVMHPKSRRVGDALKPTTLSLLKAQRKPQSADAQIVAMEAKLAAMQRRADRSPTPERVAADELEAEIKRELEADAAADERMEATDGLSTGASSAALSPAVRSPSSTSPAFPSKDASRTSSPMPLGLASLPPKPVAAASPPRSRLHDSRSPRHEDRSPRRWDDRSSYRREDHASPRRERSPRRRDDRFLPRDDRPPRVRHDRPSPRDDSSRSEAFTRGLASLPKKPAF